MDQRLVEGFGIAFDGDRLGPQDGDRVKLAQLLNRAPRSDWS